MMKLQFDPSLDYQQQAVSSVVELFLGQTPMQSKFTVRNDYCGQASMITEHGIGNRMELQEDEILSNLQAVQLRNGLAQTKKFPAGTYNFDIEMETGTGKTYVYLRSIYELHKAYGFTKFIIVVPSIAIKEGVYKSLQITGGHFANLYDNTICDYFVYDSSKLEQVRSFAVGESINIMVINIDAFRKSFVDEDQTSKANIIHRPNDKLSGMKPIELIRETSPFVIIDEPQSVDTTAKSKEAIASLNPLCIFRYSATHVEKHNLIYKLDAVDSFDMGLVKQIEVASFQSLDYHNKAYMMLKSADNKKSPITAKLDLDVNDKGSVKRKTVTVKQRDDLYDVSKGRSLYEGYIVDDIYCEKGGEYLTFASKPDILRIGAATGDIDDLAIKEQQIRKTIEEHLNKELVFNHRGIKVLSLFFIDRVSNYRSYDENGVAHNGIYAELFEKHYRQLIALPKYHTLFGDIDLTTDVSAVHNGYFSIDKKGVPKDTNGNTAADDDAYSLIMKEKERLLSFDTKLRFIFSHSALREGWDNPNVFQICTLNETHSEVKKRQEIGRGLRLCVNQQGERQYGFAVNTLTVMANESYEEFAAKLQREYEQDEGIRFGIVEKHTFANISIKQLDGSSAYLGEEKSEQIYTAFQRKGYIDVKGGVQESLKRALKNGNVELPPDVEESRPAILAVCKKTAGNLNIKPAGDKRSIGLNKSIYLGPDFRDLWDHIKYKTTYAVQFDSTELIDKCCKSLQLNLVVGAAKLIYSKAKVDISAGGVDTTETLHASVMASDIKEILPDVVTYLQNRTNLTRKTLVEILVQSKTLDLFRKNPQRYMEDVAKLIVSEMRLMIVDGIKYTKLGQDEYYAQELFDDKELTGYFQRNMMPSGKSVYQNVVYDSENERNFAEQFENNESVKLYAKLPDWFKIPTPLGSYNPDWVVLMEKEAQIKLYFVLETKGSILSESLRPIENAKICCGSKHFDALGSHVVFDKAAEFKEFLNRHL